MNIQEIRQIATEIDKADAEMAQLIREFKTLNLSGHQNNVTLHVRFGNESIRSLTVADNNREPGSLSPPVRGLALLMLGIKKWYAAEIDRVDRKSVV